MRTLTMSLILSMFLALGISSISLAQNSSGSVEDEIIALTYKIWKAENENDMATRKNIFLRTILNLTPAILP